MLKIGITGGIGSGKTTICNFFSLLGVPIFNADQEAKWLMQHTQKLIEDIQQVIGQKSYNNDGSINRKHIAQIVFNNVDKLKQLNQLVHPFVLEHYNEWCSKQTHTSFIVHESALLYESGFWKHNDYNILVQAPQALRIKRIIKRDGLSKHEIEKRMAQQWTDKQKVNLADYVIKNDETVLVLPQALKLYKEFYNLNQKQ